METQGQKARRNLRKKLTDIGIGPTAAEAESRRKKRVNAQASAKQGPKAPASRPTPKPMGPKEDTNARRARNTTVQPVPPKPTITAKERWNAMGEQSKATRARANQAPEPLPNNTFTQTDAYSRRRIAQPQQSAGIGTYGAGVVGGTFRPRDTALGRQQLGLPTRAEQNAQRVRSNGPGQSILRQGQTRLNLPAANAEKMAAADLRRKYANQRRRNASEGSAVRLQANSRLTENEMDNMTTRRGQNMVSSTTRRGQDVTARGQDINANVQYRGQDVTARGQDLNYDSTLRGQDVTRRGQDVTMRGQDTVAETARRNQNVTMRGQDTRANSYKYGVDAGVYNNDQDNMVFSERTQAQTAAAYAGLQSEQDQEMFSRAESQIEMMATNEDGEIDPQYQARMHGTLQEAAGLPEQFRGVTMQSIGEITNVLDQLNIQQQKRGGDRRITLSDLAATDKEGRPLISVGTNKMGFFEALLQGHLPGYEELSIQGFDGFDADAVDALRSRQVENITRIPTRNRR